MKVMTILGTRPELIKLSEIIKKLDQHVDHVFVHTGQNYAHELNEIFYKDLGLRRPDYQLEWHGKDLGAQLASGFFEVGAILEKERPDAVVILGDTNSAFVGGVLAKRMKIPLFHLEAGNRCFDDNVPEEINRRILDHIADVNMAYSENSLRYLMAEGIAKDRTFIMGSPMKEVLERHLPKIKKSKALKQLKLKRGQYFLVNIHRDENTEIEANLKELLVTLVAIRNKYQMPVIVSTHPRLKKKLEGIKGKPPEGIQFVPAFGFHDYIKLQLNAKCVISDSGTIAEESSILRFPAITIRNAVERPEAVDVGSLVITGVDRESIMRCLEIAQAPTSIPADWDIDNCSDRVLNVVLSYTPYVNRYVWRK